MSTKAVIQSLIDTKLADASDILASELREVQDIILDELFPITTNYALTTGDIQYNLNFTKSGNVCVVSGFIKNNLATLINGIPLFTIPSAIYYPKLTQFFFGNRFNTTSNVTLTIGDASYAYPNAISLRSALPAGERVQFNLTYIVND